MTVLLQDWEPTYLGRFRSALTSPYFIHRFCDKESNIYSIVLFSFNHMPLIRDLVLYYYLTSQLFSFLICSEVQCSDILGNFSEWVSLWVNELVNGREKGLLIAKNMQIATPVCHFEIIPGAKRPFSLFAKILQPLSCRGKVSFLIEIICIPTICWKWNCYNPV